MQLAIMPLGALMFILFIYYLAIQHSPESPARKSPIRISRLQVIETSYALSNPDVFSAGFSSPLKSGPVKSSPSHRQDQTAVQDHSKGTFLAVHARMYSRKPFLEAQDTFLPSDRLYLVMDFENLNKGKHLLSATWVDPSGKTVNKAEHTINLDKPAARYRSFFWLELMKNGGFTEMVTGREYKGNVYGPWHVELFLNGFFVARRHFTIQDL